jgi:hypothetical protein
VMTTDRSTAVISKLSEVMVREGVSEQFVPNLSTEPVCAKNPLLL